MPGRRSGRSKSPTFREGYRGATARQNHCHPAQFSVICGSSNECFGSDCENGGRLSHICTIAMEMGIPCITQATRAMEIILDGQTVFLDASSGLVYDDSIKGL